MITKNKSSTSNTKKKKTLKFIQMQYIYPNLALSDYSTPNEGF